MINLYNTNEKFYIDNQNFAFDEKSNKYEKNRTKLYGSLFLDNLDKVIQNMTDPEIKYNTKRIELLRYQDILG